MNNKSLNKDKVLNLQQLEQVSGGAAAGREAPMAWSTMSRGCGGVGGDEWSTMSDACPKNDVIIIAP